jgi:Leucine-rich repeat (LRR) protein
LDAFRHSLKVLNVSENQLRTLSDVPTTTLSNLSTSFGLTLLVNLVSLDVSNNKIMTLDGLQALRLLQRFDITNNLIGSVIEVNKLKCNGALRFLTLGGNPIAQKA